MWFKRLKVAQIVIVAIIPFAAGMELNPYFTGGLGVLIVILESLQSLNQYQHNWMTYRSTCEALKHEKHLWLAKAGPYLEAENPEALLAERVEALISREHAKWVAQRRQPAKEKS
jgi:hypothetical protein